MTGAESLFGKIDDVKAKQRRRAHHPPGADVAARAAHDDTADPADVSESEMRNAHPAPPAPPAIPAHLRKYLVDAPPEASTTAWRDDYDHTGVDGDGRPRYPDGVCSRPDCRPCRTKALDGDDAGQTWAGLARMAAARRGTGVGLDDLDLEALRRAAADAEERT